MYYYKENGDLIEKYKVVFDREEIEKLMIEIINNCSEIKHVEYKGNIYHKPDINDTLKIRNYKEEKTEEGYYDDFENTRYEWYQYSYDEYKYPELVYLIRDLLNGNPNSISKIFNMKYNSFQKKYNRELTKISKELDKINNLDIEKKMLKLKELEQQLKKIKLNKNQKPIDKYQLKLKTMISLNLVDTITLEEVKKYNNFFNNDISDSLKKHNVYIKIKK